MRHSAPSVAVKSKAKNVAQSNGKAKQTISVPAKKKHWFYDAGPSYRKSYIADHPESKFAKDAKADKDANDSKQLTKSVSVIAVVSQPGAFDSGTEDVPQGAVIMAFDRRANDEPGSPLDNGFVFQEDARKKSAGLHMFYTRAAVSHLRTIDEALTKLADFSNINMLDMLYVMQNERSKLVRENAAYCEADEILKGLKLEVGAQIVPAGN